MERRRGPSRKPMPFLSLLVGASLFCGSCGASKPAAEEEKYAKPDWTYDFLPNGFDSPTVRANYTTHAVYQNLWYHAGRFFAVTPASHPPMPDRLSVAVNLHWHPSTSLESTFRNMMSITFQDAVLVVDHAYNAYPEDLAFWGEALIGAVNVLANSSLPEHVGSRAISKLLFPNVFRKETPMWIVDLMKVALSLSVVPIEVEGKGPSIMFLEDLNMVNRTYWIHMNEILLPVQRYSSKALYAGFSSPEVASAFRSAAYKWAEGQGGEGSGAEQAKFLTLVSYDGQDGDVENKDEVLEVLKEVAEEAGLGARHVVLSNRSSTATHIHAMRGTAVLVSRFSPALANVMFLPQGATLVELVPYNWVIQDLNQLYRNITLSVGDLHYRSWAADEPRFCSYKEPRDSRFALFLPEECSSSHTCIEVHKRAGVVVDTGRLKALVRESLAQSAASASLSRA